MSPLLAQAVCPNGTTTKPNFSVAIGGTADKNMLRLSSSVLHPKQTSLACIFAVTHNTAR